MIRTEEARKAKIRAILNSIREEAKKDRFLIKDRLIAEIGFRDGVTPRKVKEYIKTLTDLGLVYEEKLTKKETILIPNK